MHKLLQRQLKKHKLEFKLNDESKFQKFLDAVNQAYCDNDENREFLEHILVTSSTERQELYEELQEKAQRDLEKSEAKYMRLVENLNKHYFFYTHDVNGIFTYLSDSITPILGYSKEEFLTHYEEYLTDDSMNKKVIEYTNLSLSGQSQEPYKLSIYHKDGTICYLEVTEVPIFNAQGEVVFIDGIARDITQQYSTQEELAYLAKHDVLTSLTNRVYLEEELNKLIAHSKKAQSNFAFLFLDLDHFKQINDTLGHHIGDKLLQNVAQRIKPEISREDIFSRLGGDEFVIIFNKVDETSLTTKINKVMNLMRSTWKIDSHELKVSVSVGIAMYPNDGNSMLELMKNADIAMYKSKALGRDNFSFFTEELNTKVYRDMQLEQSMARALEENQFILHYQPKRELSSDKLIGAEALVRWEHPTFGLIYPDEFIGLCENTGFILKLGKWIIEEGCRAIATFNTKREYKELSLSVNVSTRQLQNNDICEIIKNALDENKIASQQLIIEITESIMVDNNEKMIDTLNTIRSYGVSLSMDDFGTGYSSLSYLNSLPINEIKIDKTFVDEIPKNGDKKVLLDIIIAMGETLGIRIIAEGVEEEYQKEYLLNTGCLSYQGYLFSKPISKNEYIKFLDK